MGCQSEANYKVDREYLVYSPEWYILFGLFLCENVYFEDVFLCDFWYTIM